VDIASITPPTAIAPTIIDNMIFPVRRKAIKAINPPTTRGIVLLFSL
jgi:hypothetical protein